VAKRSKREPPEEPLEPKKAEGVVPARAERVQLATKVRLLSAPENDIIVETMMEEDGKMVEAEESKRKGDETEKSNLVPSDEFLDDVSKQNRE
jgi:hypothetical protein